MKGGLSFQAFSYNSSIIEYSMPRDSDARRQDAIHGMDIRVERDLDEVLTAFGQVTYDNDRMRRANRESDLANRPVSIDLAQTRYAGEAGLRLHNPWHVLQVGVQQTFNAHDANTRSVIAPDDPAWTGSSVRAYNPPQTTRSTGLFLSEDFTPTPDWRFTGAVRADRDSILMDEERWWLSPRAAIAWQATRIWTTKVMYNTATRMPAPWASPINRLDTDPASRPATWVNEPADRPERLTAYEFQNILSTELLWYSVNVYYQSIDDFMTWGRPFTNVGDYRGIGAETSLRAQLAEGWQGWVNGSYSRPRFSLTKEESSLPPTFQGNMSQEELPWTPRFVVNAGLQVEVGGRTTISPTLRSFFREVVYNTAPPASVTTPTQEIYHRAYLDITSHTDHVGGINGLQLDVSIRNATNNRLPIPAVWQNTSLYRSEPIVFTGTVTYDF